jgi:magnesium chelatase family protein
VRTNAEMPPRAVRATCKLTADAERELERLSRRRITLTGRGVDRLIKVARTIADLDGTDAIDVDEIREAACYRALDSLTPMHAALARDLIGAKTAAAGAAEVTP